MKLLASIRKPKWIVVSVYIGSKKKHKGRIFTTPFTFYRKKIADARADYLNNKASFLNGTFGPGKDFEFQVVPFEEVE